MGLNDQGRVVERLEDAVVVIETVWDEKDRLIRETIYLAEGKQSANFTNLCKWYNRI